MTHLSEQRFSLDHAAFTDLLAHTDNLLIIQDLDGVCMGLVKDPLTRQLDRRYIEAVPAFNGHFYVLTNGEHVGQRGVNNIVERAMGEAAQGKYLPGLAAGGVQWQNCQGELSHPGVSDAELAFLKAVPDKMSAALDAFLDQHCPALSDADKARCIEATVLNNVASPTANLNTCYEVLQDAALYQQLQQRMAALTQELLQAAQSQGLDSSFFVHYAPNLGRDDSGQEVIWWADQAGSGTTDFQFMLRGAIKEAGVLALLNRYYFDKLGHHPLGIGFSAREAPRTMADMLALAKQDLDPALMPTIVGVGDTITSQAVDEHGQTVFKRGGSDRNFLQLIQHLGQAFKTPNVITYVDSSGGELKNRRPLSMELGQVASGPGDPADADDPLTLNVVFPGGHQQYVSA
ncbi:MAG: glucosylglycerol 3-phosphatase, partial [Cyanobacteria bacterium P01_A01_bin.105]